MWISRYQEALGAWLVEGSCESSVGTRLEDTVMYSIRNTDVRQQDTSVVGNVIKGSLADAVLWYALGVPIRWSE